MAAKATSFQLSPGLLGGTPPQQDHCVLCTEVFDVQQRVPWKLPSPCIHSVCQKCQVILIGQTNQKCPIDQLAFDASQLAFDMNTFIALQRQIETHAFHRQPTRYDFNLCCRHNAPKDKLCMKEMELYCQECTQKFHKHHQILSIKEAQIKAQEIIAQMPLIDHSTQNMTDQYKLFVESLELAKQLLKDELDKRFAAKLEEANQEYMKSIRIATQYQQPQESAINFQEKFEDFDQEDVEQVIEVLEFGQQQQTSKIPIYVDPKIIFQKALEGIQEIEAKMDMQIAYEKVKAIGTMALLEPDQKALFWECDTENLLVCHTASKHCQRVRTGKVQVTTGSYAQQLDESHIVISGRYEGKKSELVRKVDIKGNEEILGALSCVRYAHSTEIQFPWLYIVGGCTTGEQLIDKCERFHLIAKTQQELAAIPIPIIYPITCIYKKKIFSFGGEVEEDKNIDAIQVLDIETLQWEVLNLLVPNPFRIAKARTWAAVCLPNEDILLNLSSCDEDYSYILDQQTQDFVYAEDKCPLKYTMNKPLLKGTKIFYQDEKNNLYMLNLEGEYWKKGNLEEAEWEVIEIS